MKTKKDRRKPILLPSGAASFRVGVIREADDPGAHINGTAAIFCGLKEGDWVQIDLDDQGTRIVRELCCSHGPHEMCDDYVYVDRQSFHYLGARLHERVEMKKTDLEMECP